MSRLLLKADVARLLDISPASVRKAAISGKLTIAATTERGVRLFSLEDVERFRREREARQARPARSGESA